MFDVSWSELLILGAVALIFVGPKELPRFLNMLGRYLGVIRRHANEFRTVIDQAMREAEMDDIQKEVRAVSDGVKASLDDATRSVDSVKQAVRTDTLGQATAEQKEEPGVMQGAEAAPSEAPQPTIAPPRAETGAGPGAEDGIETKQPDKPAATTTSRSASRSA